MEAVYQWIISHANGAPYLLFVLFLLAGLNIPLSIDVLVIIAALIGATLLPDKVILLFFCCFLGCYFSAQLAYALGRFGGRRLLKTRLGNKLFPKKRLDKIHSFYKKHSTLTLLIGRFIPFGVRNALFMSSGMTNSSFVRFAITDFFTCLLWTSLFYFGFYQLGTNYGTLVHYAKIINLIIFFAFGVTVIAIIWYKRRKGRRDKDKPFAENP